MRLFIYKSILIPLLLFVITIASYGQCENDTQIPTAICNDAITIKLEEGLSILTSDLINESSSDNCTATENLDIRLEDGNDHSGEIPETTELVYEQPGQFVVTLTVIDEAGNVSRCWSTVTVLASQEECADDEQSPQLTCIDLQTIHIGPIFAQDFVLSISDNCSNPDKISYGLELVDDFTGTMPADFFIDFTEPGIYTVYVWAADSKGNSTYCKTKILINETIFISGFLYHDENSNCNKESEETGLDQSVKITLIENDTTIYTDIAESRDGIYSSHLPKPQSTTARVEISVVNENLTSCETLYTLEVAETQTELVVEDIGIQLTAGCADLGVSVEAIEGNCNEEGLYIIKFYNGGDQPTNPLITLDFSNTVLFDLNRAFVSHAYIGAPISTGNTHVFSLSNLLPGQEGSIFIFGTQDCDYANQTQVITATIESENACSNNWTGPELNITQNCVGDEVEFKIQNVGAEDMTSPSNFVVIEDVIMLRENAIQLAAGASEILSVPANGATYHLQAKQVLDYPWDDIATTVSEGCATNAANITTGLVAQLPLENSAPHIDVAILENKTTTYNTFTGLPVGVGAKHLIAANTPIEYLIEYSNDQQSIAKTLSIEVELSEQLDIASLKTIFSSEPSYNVIKKAANVVVFTFPRIDLVSSNSNTKESTGILKFSINQKADLASNTKIESKVAIQFNENAPLTERIFHTVGDLNFSTAIEDLLINPIGGLTVYPNPFTYSTTFEFENITNTKKRFELYNAKGQLVQEQVLNTSKFKFHRKALNEGLYFYVFKEEGQLVRTGKVFIE